jgi:hypothetical protein
MRDTTRPQLQGIKAIQMPQRRVVFVLPRGFLTYHPASTKINKDYQ